MAPKQEYIQRAHPTQFHQLQHKRSQEPTDQPFSLYSPYKLRQSALLNSRKNSQQSDHSISKEKYRRSVPLSVKFYDIPECNHLDEDNDEKQRSINNEKQSQFRQTIIDNIINIDNAYSLKQRKKFQSEKVSSDKSQKMLTSQKTDVSQPKRSDRGTNSFRQSMGSLQDDNLEELLINELKKINAYQCQKQAQVTTFDQRSSYPTQTTPEKYSTYRSSVQDSLACQRLPYLPTNKPTLKPKFTPQVSSAGCNDSFDAMKLRKTQAVPLYRNKITIRILDEVFIFKIILNTTNNHVSYHIESQKQYPQNKRRVYDCLDYFTIDVFIDHVVIVNDLRANKIAYGTVTSLQGEMRARLNTVVPLRDPSRAITSRQCGLEIVKGTEPLKGISWQESGRKK